MGTSKGLIAGNLTLKLLDGSLIDCHNTKNGKNFIKFTKFNRWIDSLQNSNHSINEKFKNNIFYLQE